MENNQNKKIMGVVAGVVALILITSGIFLYSKNTLKSNQNTNVPANEEQASTENVNSISGNVFKNANYSLPLPAKEGNGMVVQNISMKDGRSQVAEFTLCYVQNPLDGKLLPLAIDQKAKTGIVTVNCHYGASGNDVYLVSFKNLDTDSIQTSFINIRKNSELQNKDTSKIAVDSMILNSNGLLQVTVLYVPDSQKNEAMAVKNPTEKIELVYSVNDSGKLAELVK